MSIFKSLISEHTISIDGTDYNYRIRFSQRAKNIQLQINQQAQLKLILPYRFRNFDHNSFIESKSKWIRKHLRKFGTDEFYYFGERIAVVQLYSLFITEPKYNIDNKTLFANLISGDERNLQQVYSDWLYAEAKRLLPSRVIEIARKNFLFPEKISIRKQRTRWGSCSQSGTIFLNYKLLSLKTELIDYIIVHELCHLKEMNHSKKFWSLVESIIPGYKSLRKELRQIRIFN